MPVVRRRKEPHYPAVIVGRPPMEDYYMGKVTERIFLPMIKLVLPELVDMNMPAEGSFHNLVIVSVKKEYPGQARKVMYGLWGLGLMSLVKAIIVVDHDVNVHNISEVAWRVTNNIDPAQDFVFSWRRGLLPDTAADYVAFFWMIKGGREFYDWRVNELARFNPKQASADELWERTLAKFNALVGVKALDSRTLRVELEAPVPYFLDIVAFPVFYPVYPPLLRQYEQVDPKSGRLKSDRGWTKPPRLISNGPF